MKKRDGAKKTTAIIEKNRGNEAPVKVYSDTATPKYSGDKGVGKQTVSAKSGWKKHKRGGGYEIKKTRLSY